MSKVTESIELFEHMHHEHGDHHDNSPHPSGQHAPTKLSQGTLIGLTMGLIAILIALCAAFVGGERNEMTRTMIEQTQANSNATSASIKFRLVMLNIERLRVEADVPQALRERFVRLFGDYGDERALSANWASSYDPLITTHFNATEGYERAQLIAEVGVVLASIAVLLGSRIPWYASILMGGLSIGQIGMTYVKTQQEVQPVLANIEHLEHAYKELRRQHTSDNSDEVAVNALDPDAKIRKAIEAKLKNGAAIAAE